MVTDARAGEVHDRVESLERGGLERAPRDADDGVAFALETRQQGRPDESMRPGDGYAHVRSLASGAALGLFDENRDRCHDGVRPE